MSTTLVELDEIMERASQALAGIDYLNCEALCLRALALARQANRYRYYARILMPLQEARRQRRMLAAAGDIQLGSSEPSFDPQAWLKMHEAGCIVLTHPYTAEAAISLEQQARKNRQYVEVLFADNSADADTWALRSYTGAAVTCMIAAPTDTADKAQWFVTATEKLGDAALANVDGSLEGVALIEALERHLAVFTDHELLHQRLAEAARSVRV